MTCTKCWIVARGSLKTTVPCHGTEATCCSKQRVLWNNIKDTSNGMALLRAWGVSQTDVEEWMFGVAVAPSVPGFDAKGHDWHLVEVGGKKAGKKCTFKLWTCSVCRLFHATVCHMGACRGAILGCVRSWKVALFISMLSALLPCPESSRS